MATLMPYLPHQFSDDNGAPLAGGKVYTYIAGTVTPKATYTTFFGTTPHDNPIILDASGRPDNGTSIWLGSGGYKFIVKDSLDVEIDTIDNVNSDDGDTLSVFYVENIAALKALTAGQYDLVYVEGYYTPGDGGGGWFDWDADSTATMDNGVVIQVNAGGDGRYNRIVDGNVSPLWFGAKGDGTTDASSAMSYANTYADSVNKSIVVDGGTYLFATNPALTVPVIFSGDGMFKVTVTTFNMPLIPVVGINDLKKHFDCSGEANAPVFPAGTTITPQFFGAKGDSVTDDSPAFSYAVYALQTNGGTVRVPETKLGYMIGDACSFSTQIPLKTNVSIVGDGYGALLTCNATPADEGVFFSTSAVSNVTIEGITVDGSKGEATTGRMINAVMDGCEIKNCWFENAYNEAIYLDATDTVVRNNHFKNCGNATEATGCMLIYAGTDAVIEGNVFDCPDDEASYGLALKAPASSTIAGTIIRANQFIDCEIVSSTDSGAISGLALLDNSVLTDGVSHAVTLLNTHDATVSGNIVRSETTSTSNAFYESGNSPNDDIVYGVNSTYNFTTPFALANSTIIDTRLGFEDYSDVASASTATLNKGFVNNITGNTNIKLIDNTGWRNGGVALLKFSSSTVIDHNETASGTAKPVSLILAADTAYAPNDIMLIRYADDMFYEVYNSRTKVSNGGSIVSAGSLDIGAYGFLIVTGTTNISYISTTGRGVGSVIILKKGTGNADLLHNAGTVPANYAALYLDGATTYQFDEGKTVQLVYDGTYFSQF
jgi:hypothetical protein